MVLKGKAPNISLQFQLTWSSIEQHNSFSSTYYIDYYLRNIPTLSAAASVTVTATKTVAVIYWFLTSTLLLFSPIDSCPVGPENLAQHDFLIIRSCWVCFFFLPPFAMGFTNDDARPASERGGNLKICGWGFMEHQGKTANSQWMVSCQACPLLWFSEFTPITVGVCPEAPLASTYIFVL